MPKILILQGQAQYNAARCFVRSLTQALLQIETINVFELDITMSTSLAEMISQVEASEVDIVFSVNGIGAEVIKSIPISQRPQFITWLLDHPVYHFSRLMLVKPVVLCVDNEHVAFCQRLGLNACFFPHATEQPMSQPLDIKSKQGILFPASGADKTVLLNQLVQQAPEIAQLLAEDSTADLTDVMRVLQLDKIQHSVLAQQNVISLLLLCDNLLRTIKRNKLVADCAEQDIVLTIVGNGWHKTPQYKQHTYLPAQDFSQLQALMGQSRFVLHHNPGFRQGLHERILYSIQQGTQVFCQSQSFLQSKYGETGAVKFYQNVNNIPQLMNVSDEDYIKQLRKSQHITQADDTWQIRAQTLLGICLTQQMSKNPHSYV